MRNTLVLNRAVALSLSAVLAVLTGCQNSNSRDGGMSSSGSGGSKGSSGGMLSETTTDPSAKQATGDKAMANRETQLLESLAYPTGNRETSAVLLEKMGSKQIRMGQPYEYQLKVTNLTDAPLAGVEISEQLGENFKVTTAQPEAQQRNGQNVYSLGELKPGESRTINVTGTANGPGEVTSCTTIAYNPTLCTVATVIAPKINIAKSGPQQADICEEIVYKYSISNTGTGTETNVRVVDTLPDGLVSADGKKTIDFTVDAIPEGKTREFEARVRPDRVGEYSSQAKASSASGEVQSEQITTRVIAPELKVAVNGPEREYVGKAVTYEVTVENSGQAAARNAQLSFDGAGEATIAAIGGEGEAQTASGSVGGDGGQIGNIEPGQTRRYRVTVPAERAGTINVNAVAKAECAKDASAMASTTIETLPALLLEVVDRDDLVRIGESAYYTIKVTNQGTGPDTNIGITATLPPELQFVSGSGASQAQNQGQEVRFAPVPSLAAGKSIEWNVEAKATKAGDVRFRLDMNSDSLGKNVTETEATRLY
ncbi:MAG TPA: CARDB domain-containing protein [Tepidisphaeraceae bacterium]|jgi:uncharacterized repeat protein (TIGR01451 family)|nr:CARDB domain-containing protein [Tepidisphaeraceae bacterium]